MINKECRFYFIFIITDNFAHDNMKIYVKKLERIEDDY